MSQIIMPENCLQPGIYFGLDENVYHRDAALSRSNIVHILDTPRTYWVNSWMNPRRKHVEPNKDMVYGSAQHCYLFEPHLFNSRYQIIPTLGEPWDSRAKISQEDFQSIEAAVKVLREGKDSSMFLSGGMPEVTIVFDFNGLRYRVRIDWLMIPGTSDFKTTRALDDWHIRRENKDRGLDVQVSLYRLARTRFKEQYRTKEAHVYGTVDPAFFHKFMREEMNEFMFIFQRKTPPYPFRALLTEDDTDQDGADKIADASTIYKKYMAEFGTNPWPVSEGKVERFSMRYGGTKF